MKNKYRIDGNIVYIKLNRKDGNNLETMIDLDDFDLVNGYSRTWCASYKESTKSFYCQIHIILDTGKQTKLKLHRVIMNVVNPKLQIDHINHNTLDNRKENLRIVKPRENMWNLKNTKGYRWREYNKKWQSYIVINGKQKSLGYYITEEEAKQAYLDAKEIYHVIGENKKSEKEILEFEKNIKKEPKGYSWNKKLNKWRARIKINGKEKHLGFFKTGEEAHQVYMQSKYLNDGGEKNE